MGSVWLTRKLAEVGWSAVLLGEYQGFVSTSPDVVHFEGNCQEAWEGAADRVVLVSGRSKESERVTVVAAMVAMNVK